MMLKIPERYRQEYKNLQEGQFKTRTSLFIRVALGIYYLVSLFYLLRYVIGDRDIFNPGAEFCNWVVLFIGSGLIYVANLRSRTPQGSKICGHIFNVFLVSMICWLGFLYPSSALAFPFYFTLGFIVVAFTMPWSIRELCFLFIVECIIFSGYCAVIVYLLHYPAPELPRFHFYFDGLILLFIAAGLSIVLRLQRMNRDIQNFILLKEVEEKKAQIEKDLEFANLIHRTLIPESVQTSKVDIAVSYLPVSYVGGDYARFHFWKDEALLFFICDVTGHGVAAALMVNRIHSEFERLAKEGLEPGIILQKLNQFIHADFTGTGMYLSAFCGKLDFKKQQFSFSNYGHPPQFFHQTEKLTMESMHAHATLLGIAEEGEIYQSEMLFESGDRIFLFTDGIPEAEALSGERFGLERMEQVFRKHSSKNANHLNETMLSNLQEFTRNLTDDVLLLTIQIH